MPDAQCAALLTLPGLVLALTSQIHLKDGEKASAKLGHSDKRNSQSQNLVSVSKKAWQAGALLLCTFRHFKDDVFSHQCLLGLTAESLPCS